MGDCRRDRTQIDDQTLTAREAARIWRLCPENLRFKFVISLPEALADQVITITAERTQEDTHAP